MSSLFNIGLSGLQAAKYAMYMTGHNLVNADDPFFARRTFSFNESSSGWGGLGVKISDVRRVADAAADSARLTSTQSWSHYEALNSRLKHFETSVDHDDVRVDKFINDSLGALETLNAMPSSLQNRNNYLSQLNIIVNQFHNVAQKITQEMADSKASILNGLGDANTTLAELAALNKRIATQHSSDQSDGMTLLDRRDVLLDKLAHLMNFDKKIQANGTVNLYFNNGQPLLIDENPGLFVVDNVGDANAKPQITLKFFNESINVDSFLKAGTIGGNLDYYDSVLLKSKQSLDRIALAFAQNINGQNQLGVDLKGAIGGNLFNDINDAKAMASRAVANVDNTGTANIGVFIQDVNQLQTSDYELTFFDDSHYQLTRTSDGHVVQTGELESGAAKVSVDGFIINISSAQVSVGEKYIISPLNQGAKQFNLATQDAGKIALGFPVITSTSSTNQGQGEMTLTAMTDTSTGAFSIPGALNPPIRVEFLSSDSFRLVNAEDSSIIADHLVYDPLNGTAIFPTPGGYDPGYRINLSGNIQAGDTFAIDYNANGAGDNRNGLLLADLYQKSVLNQGQLTFVQSYQQFVFDISTKSNEAKINLETSQVLKTQAEMRRDEFSAVSVEEEMNNMTRYQESYMASAQILDVVKKNMDILFSIVFGR